MNTSVLDPKIKILLIKKNELDASRLMHQVYDLCKEYKCNVKWVKEYEVDSGSLRKTDILVFEEFSGPLFNSIIDKKCAVLGPLVISACLSEDKPLPPYTWPMYNVAMYSCVVTATGLPDSKKGKASIKEKVELMGGWYIQALTKDTTHLIVGSVRTDKYLAAVAAGVTLMRQSWIEDVWAQSQNKNIHSCEAHFLEKHKARTFEGITVSSTCIPTTEEKKQVEKMITENGGQYSANLVASDTNVLICGPNCTVSEKYKVARKKSHIRCVTVDWVIDSIKKGHALPCQDYNVQKTTSTPTKQDNANPDFSVLSVIFPPNISHRSTVDESMLNSLSVQKSTKESVSSQQDTLAKLLEDADNSNLLKPGRTVQPEPSKNPTELSKESVSVTQDETCVNIFEGLKFLIEGFEQEEYENLKEKVEYLGGEMVTTNFKGVPDYVVVPISNSQTVTAGMEAVNDLFIHECEHEGLVTDIAYYHRPLRFHQSKPYVGCVITISSYSRFERLFLQNVIELLGGIFQEQFARVTAPAKGVLASTHLVCPVPTGKKYGAALKWGLPVVSKDWVLECAKSGRMEPEGKFLLGDSKAPERKEEEAVPETTLVPVMFSAENITPRTAKRKERTINENGTPETDAIPEKSATCPGTSNPTYTPPPVSKTSASRDIFVKPDHRFSPITPVKKIMRGYRSESEIPNSQTPEMSPCSLKPWDFLKTPDTPLGRIFTPNPSPRLRKQCEYWLMQFPDREETDSNASTPLSEIKKRLWDKILRRDVPQPNFDDDEDTNADEKDEGDETPHTPEDNPTAEEPRTPENQNLASKFKQLEDMLSASGNGGKRQSRTLHSITPAPAGNMEYQDSQPGTVGWDFKQGETAPSKHIFSLSNVTDEDRTVITGIIVSLGGTVSELANYDPQCTHLICSRPARNEKPLACMAAGKWILHTKYIYESQKAGKLLDEELYEFGNPKSAKNVEVPNSEKCRIEKAHWWRKEVKRRGCRAFNGMRAIVVAEKKDPIIRVIEAGSGVVVDAAPPFDSYVHATHCLIDNKCLTDLSAFIPLAEQGVYLLPTVYISDYLYNPSKDIKNCIIPYFTKYYSRSFAERTNERISE